MKKKIAAAQEEKKRLEAEKPALKQEVAQEEAQCDQQQKEIDSDAKRIESLLRDILNKNVIKSDDKTKRQIELVKQKEGGLQDETAAWNSALQGPEPWETGGRHCREIERVP